MDNTYENLKKKLNNNVYKIVGMNLTKIRKALKMTQPEFAKQLNEFLFNEFNIKSSYDYKTISNWESGKSIPKRK